MDCVRGFLCHKHCSCCWPLGQEDVPRAQAEQLHFKDMGREMLALLFLSLFKVLLSNLRLESQAMWAVFVF